MKSFAFISRSVVISCSRLLHSDADDADAWHALGVALAALGDRRRAVAALRIAIQLDDKRAETQMALGRLLFDTFCVDDALRFFACAAVHDASASVEDYDRGQRNLAGVENAHDGCSLGCEPDAGGVPGRLLQGA